MTEQEASGEEKREGQPNQKRASAAALINAFANQYAADREENKTREKHRIFREWLTIAGLFLAALVAAFQWNELRSTDHSIAEQARVSAEQLKEIRAGAKQTDVSADVVTSPPSCADDAMPFVTLPWPHDAPHRLGSQWPARLDLNQKPSDSKSAALPLRHAPVWLERVGSNHRPTG